jgi:hypothetical protein
MLSGFVGPYGPENLHTIVRVNGWVGLTIAWNAESFVSAEKVP